MKALHKALIIALVFVSFFATGTVLAQGEEPPACPEDRGCFEISLYPATLTGDFYLGEMLLAAGQNPALFQVEPRISQRIDVRNIQDSAEGFGELFVWSDDYITAWVPEGQVRRAVVYPRKVFIRGTLDLTCDIRQAAEGDSVACAVTIDDTPQPDPILPGQRTSYILDPGSHTIGVTLVGDHASLWSPTSAEHTASIWAGGTAYLRSTFEKAGHLTITLDQPDVVADIYVDDELIASQVASAELWVEPYRSLRVEARNVTDPAAGDIYRWLDATGRAYLSPGQERIVQLRLTKQYLKGFLNLQCTIPNLPPEVHAYCQPTIDGTPVEGIAQGTMEEYVLDPGQHEVTVVVGPESEWPSSAIALWPYISPGITARYTVSPTIEQPTPPSTTTPSPEGLPIYVGPILSSGYDMGVDTSGHRYDWLTDMGGYMRMTYPPGQSWGVVYITVGRPAPHGQRQAHDYSMYTTLAVDLRGEHGGEVIYVGIKDRWDPDNGSETKIPVTLTSDWQTYTFSLSSFATADLANIYIPAEFVFEPGIGPETVYFRNVRYLR